MSATLTAGDVHPAAMSPVGEASDHSAAVMGSERYLSFVLRGETFALPILDVTEIMEFRSLTTVPMMPSFIRGVINLRGRVVPVVDISARFGRVPTQVGRRTSILIVDTSARSGDDGDGGLPSCMGILVDGVNKVMHLNPEDVEPPPAFGAGIRTDFISGMAKHDGGFIIVLNVSKALSLEDLALVARATAASIGDGAQA
jgi:purine-binding chemotaxis protein CheW